MLQYIIIGLLLIGAAIYLGRLVYLSFTSKECQSGCGSCGAIDVKAALKSIEKKNMA